MNSSNPKITVYIACHNYGRYLKEAVESVIMQTLDDWELLIVDDNSSDNTPEIIETYENNPKINTIRTKGIGLASVCNLALEHASGEYIIRLDGDDVFDENALQVLSGYLDRAPEMGLVFPDYFLIDEHSEVFSQHRHQRNYNGNQNLDMPPNGACTLIRRKILEDCGGYRTDLGAQDGFDLWAKVRDRCKMGNVNLPLFKYRRHSDNLTNNSSRIMNARRRIKLDAVEDKIPNFGPLMAVIPCRQYFEFVENFWGQKINEITLLERCIHTLMECKLLDKIIVACDNPEAEEIVTKIADPRIDFFLRSTKSTSRSNTLPTILKEIIETFDPKMEGTSVVTFCQAPFITSGTVEEVMTTLIFNDADSAYGVEKIDSQLLRRTPNGLEPINRRSNVQSDYNIVYRDSSTCFALKNHNLLADEIDGPIIANFELASPENFFIQSTYDLKIARFIANG